MGAIAEQRRLTRRCNGLLGGVGGVAKVLPAVELGVRHLLSSSYLDTGSDSWGA